MASQPSAIPLPSAADSAQRITRPPRLDSLKNPQPRARARLPRKKPEKCINPDCDDPSVLIVEDNKLVCEACGVVADDSPDLVTDLQYGVSGTTGQHVVHGHHVGADAAYAHGTTMSKQNRQMSTMEQTHMNGRNHIEQICQSLGVNKSLKDAGMQVFRLAASVNFIQGRRTKSVAAVALYIACRTQREEANEFMLIDFADELKVCVLHLKLRDQPSLTVQLNVFQLGSIYQDLIKELRLNPNGLLINPINPEDLILRFTRRLEFEKGDVMKVANDAVRIVQRMKRDWMTPGRRPAGICGAALILAARMNNYRRTTREMVYVVKVNENTIFKRLDEFKVLDSSGLTVDEFRTMDLENHADPPAFYQAHDPKFRKKRKVKQQEHSENNSDPEEGEGQESAAIAAVEGRQQSATDRRKRRVNPEEFDDDGDDLGDAPTPSYLLRMPSNSNENPPSLDGTDKIERDRRDMPPPSVSIPIDPNILDRVSKVSTGASLEAELEGVTSEQPKKRGRGRPRKDEGLGPAIDESSLTSALTDPFSATRSALNLALHPDDQPVSSSTADKEAPSEGAIPSRPPVAMTSEIDPHEFDDDPEVRDCLLGEEEVSIKTRIWTAVNSDWLRAQAAKELKHKMAVENGTLKVRKMKPRKRRRMGDLRQYADVLGEEDEDEAQRRMEEGQGFAGAADAVAAMMKHRSFSTKINYEALRGVYTPSSANASLSSSRRTSFSDATSPGSAAFGKTTEHTAPSKTHDTSQTLTSHAGHDDRIQVQGQNEQTDKTRAPSAIMVASTTAQRSEDKLSSGKSNSAYHKNNNSTDQAAEQQELDGLIGQLEEEGIYAPANASGSGDENVSSAKKQDEISSSSRLGSIMAQVREDHENDRDQHREGDTHGQASEDDDDDDDDDDDEYDDNRNVDALDDDPYASAGED